MDDEQPTSSAGKSSKKGYLVGLVVVLVVAAGIGYYFYNQNQQDKENAKKAAAANAAVNNQTTTTKKAVFAPATTEGVPFVATVKTTTGDKQVSGVMTSDGQGNISYATQAEGKNMTLVYTKDSYFLCMGESQCVKYPKTSSSSSGFDPGSYEFDGSKINSYKDSSSYKGQQACPGSSGGTCDVWSVTNGGATTTLYVDSASKRIAKVTTVSGTTSSEATYEYKNATVVVPTNYTTLPSTAQ